LPGIRGVHEIPAMYMMHQFGETSGPGSCNYICSGVAIVADSIWVCMQARKCLKVEWNEPAVVSESIETFRQKMVELASKPAVVIRNDGDFDQAYAGAVKIVEANYEIPFFAHATMEPVNCTAHSRDGECELWAFT